MLLFSLNVCKSLNLIYLYLYFYGGGQIPTPDRLMIITKRYSWSIYNKYFSNMIDMRSIIDLWCKVQVCHAALRLLICLLPGNCTEDTGLCWTWDTWCVDTLVASRDHMIVVSEVGLLLEILGTLVKKSYHVRYPVCPEIKIFPWDVALT